MKLFCAYIVPVWALLGLADPVLAEDLWEFTFTGQVTTATPGLPAPWSAVGLGETCVVRYIIDLDAPDLIPIDPDVGSFDARGFEVAFESVQTSGSSSRVDIVRNHFAAPQADSYAAYLFIPGPDIAGVFLDDTVFGGGSPDALPGDGQTASLNFGAFNTGRFFSIGYNGSENDPPRELLAELHTFESRPVPAPSTAMLALAGLIASARRRR